VHNSSGAEKDFQAENNDFFRRAHGNDSLALKGGIFNFPPGCRKGLRGMSKRLPQDC